MLPVTALGVFDDILIYIVIFFHNSVSLQQAFLAFSARPMSLRVFPLFTLAARELRAKSEA